MSSTVVIIVEIITKANVQFSSVFSWIKINIFTLQCTPESLDPDIIQTTASSIYTDYYFLIFQIANPSLIGKLHTLIRIDNIWFSLVRYGLLKNFQAVSCIQRIRKAPTNNIAAVNINNGRQVPKSFLHRDIGNVDTPDMVRMSNFQVAQFVRMDISGQPKFTQIALWVYCHQPHLAQKSSDSLGTNNKTECQQKVNHAFNTFVGMFKVFLVHQSHYFEIFRLFSHWFVIITAPGYSKKIALTANTNLRLGIDYFFEVLFIPNCS